MKTKTELFHLHTGLFSDDKVAKLVDEDENAEDDYEDDYSTYHSFVLNYESGITNYGWD